MDSGRRTLLFQEVNDRIFELLSSAEPDLPGEFLCECGDECGHRIELVPGEFAQLREKGRTVRSGDCTKRRGIFRRTRETVSGLPALS